MTITAQQSRVNALIRLVGLIVLGFGVAMILLTNANANFIAPSIVTINYSLGILLLVVGLFAALAKLK